MIALQELREGRPRPDIGAWTPLPQLVCCLLTLLVSVSAMAAPPEVVWSTHTGAPAEHGAVVLDEKLYVGAARQTTVIDIAAGTIGRFLLPPDATEITCAPTLAGKVLVAGDAMGRVLAWEDGAPSAVLTTLRRTRAVTALSSAGEDRFVVAGEAGCVTALDGRGSKLWSHCTAGTIGGALVADGEQVLAADVTGRVTAWGMAKGGYRWFYEMDAPLAGAPAVLEDTVLLASVDGHLYALDRARGVLRWRVHVGSRLSAAPAIGNGLVVVALETGGLVAIDAVKGKLAWRAPLTATPATPAFVGAHVVVGTPDNALQAFDAATGEATWRVSTPGPVLAPPLAYNEGILAVTTEGVALFLQ